MEVKIMGARLAFASLFEPKEQINGDLKYEANLLFDDEANINAMKAAIRTVAEEQWKDKHVKVLKGLEKGRKCFRKGDDNTNSDGEVYQGFEGMMFVVAKNKKRPRVVGGKKGPDGKLIALTTDDGKPYNGCYINAVVDVFTVTGKKFGGDGVFASLLAVQFVRDGDAFGGGGTASMEAAAASFDVVEGADVDDGFGGDTPSAGKSDDSDMF